MARAKDDGDQTLLLQTIVQGDKEAEAQDVGEAHYCVVAMVRLITLHSTPWCA